MEPGPEELRADVVDRLYKNASQDKYFGPESSIELRREPTLPWCISGFIRILLACVGLFSGT
ncbi:MAG: hypothetical protein ACKVGW_20585 [Verrucomicrobiia bacterium]